ncbi:hypothetical protein DFR55_101366 [Herbinix hemicellulosilytica]|uniref:Uncharacterized protein n=1 Tax=Herbinix hemicellulosilytica TaxID=1564487 RepID=A0A0H5SHQ3_HERHM|nr:hypothetical protein [Herbinix hemicellulosilytica]RBP60905.1 hypothetical protein DFR55_101366 [Herbinix hemicellulosilytica]CRZ34600.1 hypothetical protein HHT355_1399 [Herbinix hemicellulosilytica]
MYAIINKKTNMYVSGTDYSQCNPKDNTYKQITSTERALTYYTKAQAELDMLRRRMSDEYEVVRVKLITVGKER